MGSEATFAHSTKTTALMAEAALRLIFENVPHRLSWKLQHSAPDATPRHIQQAIDYMRAHLHETLTMSDIARAAGISSRSLQQGFRKHRYTSPAAYLRKIRLEAVHTELLLPENVLPVSEVASKWGFAHMGRFAAHYRAHFGVYPSDTARLSSSKHL